MEERIEEPVMNGVDVAKYVASLTPSKLHEDVMDLAHDIQQLTSMMGECMKMSMATVVVGSITVHVEMKMDDKILFESTLGHIAKQEDKKQG